MLQTFQAYLKKAHLLQPQLHFIVACSGGIDSVVLCVLCQQAGLRFSIAHCNFGLRGEESDRDEAFVTRLAEKIGVRVFVKRFDTKQYGHLKKLSVQEAARELRYQWFEELRNAQKAAFVLLAHHANDNIETVLMNLFRGTGLHGLTGMPQAVDAAHCLRPLLQHTRAEIEAFANEASLQWVEDSSNESSKYTRNFFRNEILPAVKKAYPQAEENVLHTIARLQQTEALYQQLVDGVLKKLVVANGNEFRIPVVKLLQYRDTALPYEVFKKFHFGEKQLPQILALAAGESGSFMQNEHYRIIKHRRWFVITPLQTVPTTTILIEEGVSKPMLPHGALHVKTIDRLYFNLDKSPAVAQLDAKNVQFPLVVRRWKQGDYFYPLGLGKKKKLARFFIDQKLSLADKEAVWVVESRSRIIWIVGHRIDDRFKVTDGTKQILQFRFVPQ